MPKHTRSILLLSLLAAAGWLAWLERGPSVPVARAQQAAGKDYMEHYTWHPGGTPEERLFQLLVLFGARDTEETNWSGSLEVQGGEIHAADGYRFEPPDRVLPQGGWELHTQNVRILKGSSLGHGRGIVENAVLPKGLLIRGSATQATSIAIETPQGRFSLSPMAVKHGPWTPYLDGRVVVQRTLSATDLSGTKLRQHDFPAIASGGDTLWTTWYSYHDRREELNFRRYQNGQWTRLIPVGRAAEDLWRPHVTTDAEGKPWLIWSQRPVEEGPGNWDIYAMAWEDNEWGELHRLSDGPLPDIEPAVARAADGTVYVVWQSLVGRHSQIRLRYLRDGRWSPTVHVTNTASNNWEPAVAADSAGGAWIAWDRYDGNYNVYCRRYSSAGGLGPEEPVAETERFEAHVSVAVDRQDRPWIAWESGAVNWGKDTGQVLGADAPGAPLGGPRRIEVVCFDNNEWKAPARFDPGEDPLARGATSVSRPLLLFDPDGNLWMSFKRRYSRRAFRPSVYWESFLTRLERDRWAEPITIPYSWTRKSTRMGLTAAGDRLWAFWPNENRNWAFASRPLLNRVVAGSLTLPGPGEAPVLRPYQPASVQAPPVHSNEEQDVRAIRGHRIELAGKRLRIVRGDLHRHTEFSQDVGGLDDGTLPEFYRYMIDAAEMDFGASTDHEAGGTDYWNFLTQKMADMYHFPERFTTLYAYERNIGNPFGHRNLVYTHRDYPIVPFFQKIHPKFMLPESPDGELLTFNSMSFGSAIRNDTKLLYDVLRETGGLAIPHTSGTDGMGTDWSDKDPAIDSVVEIYQGARRNYEHVGAPRGPTEEEMARGRGFQEPGMVWNAWRKGHRIGVITSSDHYSTHISYAMVYTPTTSRDDIFQSIKKRHTYGATDNIVLEFWIGDHFMGDDFSAKKKQKVRVRVHGTDEVNSVHLIRDAKYVYKVAPGREQVEFEYMDNDVGAGEHWYYVRVEQADGELAWSSPIWVRYE